MAMQIVMRLQAEFPTPVPLLTSFFEDPTVVGLATALSESGSIDGTGLDACFERVRSALREDAKLWEPRGS